MTLDPSTVTGATPDPSANPATASTPVAPPQPGAPPAGSPMAPAGPATPGVSPTAAAQPSAPSQPAQTSPSDTFVSSGHGSAGKILRGAVLGILTGAAHVAKEAAQGTGKYLSGVSQRSPYGQTLAQNKIANAGEIQRQQLLKKQDAREDVKFADEHTRSQVETNNFSLLGHHYALQNAKEEQDATDAAKARSDTANKESENFLSQIGAAGIHVNTEHGSGYDLMNQQHAKDVANGISVHVQNGQTGDAHGVGILNVNELKNTPISTPVTLGTEFTWDPKKNDAVATKSVTLPADGQTTAYQALQVYGQGQARIAQIRSEHAGQVEAEQKQADVSNKKADTTQKLGEANKFNAEAENQRAQAKLAGAGITDQNKNLTGTEFVKTLPAGMQSIIESMHNYNMDSKDLPRGKEKTPIIAALTHAYPDWSETKYNERHNYIKEYGSSTQGDGATRRRINTAIGHIDLLNGEASTYLAQNNLQKLNELANAVGAQTGNNADLVYNAIAEKAAGEVAGAVKGGGGSATDPGISAARESFKASMSPTQRGNLAKAQMQILKTQADTIAGAFTNTMGVTPEQYGQPVLFGNSAQVLNKYINGGGAAPTPQTHVFDARAWAAKNPNQDVNAAIKQAQDQGFSVKQ